MRVLVRSPEKADRLFAESSRRPELFAGDVTDAASVAAALVDCDAVVHAAATTPLAGASREQLFAVNVGGCGNVLAAAVKAGIRRIVYLSSLTVVFDTGGRRVTVDAPVVKSAMAYGQSKAAAEVAVRKMQGEGAPIAIVYPSGIVGPADPGFSDGLKALQHRMEQGFRIFGDGGMQYIDVRYLAALVAALLDADTGGRYLLPGPWCSWRQLADTLESVSGAPLHRIEASGWRMRLVGRLVDVARRFKAIDTPISAETMRYATQWPEIENTPALRDLGIELRSSRETFGDTLQWMLNTGRIAPDRVPALAQRGDPAD